MEAEAYFKVRSSPHEPSIIGVEHGLEGLLSSNQVVREADERGTGSAPPVPGGPDTKSAHCVEPQILVKHVVRKIM